MKTKDKIKSILLDFKNSEKTTDETTTQLLLLLLSIVHQGESFSLTCTNGYHEREHYCDCKNECMKCLD